MADNPRSGSTPRAYLDHNATSPVRPEVASSVARSLHLRNPSAVHAEGRRARAAVERARWQVAKLASAEAADVVFTSGATEANATALRPGSLLAQDGAPVERLVVGASEHASVLVGHGFAPDRVSVVPVTGAGLLDLDRYETALAEGQGRPTLVSVQIANNETGVVQPLAEVVATARRYGAAVHADGVQAPGRLPLGIAALGVDALSLSAHKLGGLMGAGALVLAGGRHGVARALLRGGAQEQGRRAGTEPVPAIVAFGIAADAAGAVAEEAARLSTLRDAAETIVQERAPDAVVFGRGAPRLPNTLCFAVPGLSAEVALMSFDLAGVAVSSGSACSSGKVGRSHVLAAMGVPPALAAGAIRVSFGWSSTESDVGAFADAYETMLRRLYEGRRGRAA